MADAKLKEKIRNVLKSGYFGDDEDYVIVSDGDGDAIHVVIISAKFDGKRMKEKSDLIWSDLLQNLASEECGKVSLTVGRTPEELKAS